MDVSQSIRVRYPHEAPGREDSESDAAYAEALMRFYRGQAELTEGFFAAIPFAAVTTLGDGSIAYANAQGQQLLGLNPADFSRHRATEYLHDADGNAIGRLVGERVTEGEVIRQETVYVRRPDGRRDMRLLSIAPVFMPGTRNLVRAIGLFQDPGPIERELESLRVLNRSLADALERSNVEVDTFRELAYTDEMTGLMNKRAFSEFARPMIEDARRKKRSVAMFFFDPDDFKEKNDLYGHAAGDELIREIAGRLREVSDAFDGTIVRFGGDEFYGLFLDVSKDRFEEIARTFAETLRFYFEAKRKETYVYESFLVTVAIGGVLRIGTTIPDLGELCAEADLAMYQCKESGKGEGKTKPFVLSLPRIHSAKPPIT
ncbi:MAG: sensor domain-containing diguanylate cyclase [Candidatus Uhrbacteria bacterium]